MNFEGDRNHTAERGTTIGDGLSQIRRQISRDSLGDASTARKAIKFTSPEETLLKRKPVPTKPLRLSRKPQVCLVDPQATPIGEQVAVVNSGLKPQ